MIKFNKNILKRVCQYICRVLIRIYSVFIKQNKKQILIYPNLISYKQLVDVRNYTTEGVLVLFNHLLKMKMMGEELGYECVLVCFQSYQKDIPVPKDSTGKPLYRQVYCPIKPEFSLFYIKNIFKYYYEYFSSHILITGDPFAVESLKKKTQIEFCISYYVPFKNDYLRRPKHDSNINYVISGSKVCSQIDSLASRVPYERYVPLGLPKWESLLSPRYSKEKLYSFFPYLDVNSKIIVYTPTHRDYERIEDTHRGFLGLNKDYDDLNCLLEHYNTFLFVKLHIGQVRSVIKNIKEYSHIKFFDPTHDYNLYDLLPYADLLISDYTSTYFDYLVLNRPTLFYWYDIDKYISTRGFSWNPIDVVCEGNIAYNYDELLENIKLFLTEKYPVDYKKIDYIRRLVLGNNADLEICKRIFDFIKSHT